MAEEASITRTSRASDGLPSMAIHAAKLVCGDAGCPGATDVRCPAVACSVRLVSVQEERDAETMERLRREDDKYRSARAARRAARAAKSGADQEPTQRHNQNSEGGTR
jgi:hypothetical protein